MTGKRRWSAYIVAVVAMTAAEIALGLGAEKAVGMSMNYQVGMVGTAAIHFGGIAADKVFKHKNGGTKP